MRIPSPKQLTAGDLPDEDLFNEIRYTMQFLENPPAAHVVATSGLSTTTALWTAVTFHTVEQDLEAEYDPAKPMWDAGSPTRLTVRTPGWYEMDYGSPWASTTADTLRQWAIRKNGDTAVNYGRYDHWTGAEATEPFIPLAFGDYYDVDEYIQLIVKQTSGGALSTDSDGTGDQPFLRMRWVSF